MANRHYFQIGLPHDLIFLFGSTR